jgi:ribosomal protein S18 acetylase RimI-like enzyme
MSGAPRPYRGADEAALLDCWRRTLPLDALSPEAFVRRVLLDANFDPARLLVVGDGDAILGFCLSIIRRVPAEKGGMDEHRGWITAFGVAPEARGRGIGSALLDAALAAMPGREVRIADYVPGYFVPGVDVAAYAEGLAWLQRRGFQVVSRPLAMEADLNEGPAPTSHAVSALRRDEIPALLGFLDAHMPGDWLRDARQRLADLDCGRFLVTREGEAIVGYATFDGEHFGPFGVREDRRGQGLGRALLAATLARMHGRGERRAWLLWTSDEAARRVYAPLGFREWRRFAVLSRVG